VLGAENRLFAQPGIFGNPDQWEGSLSLKPELSHSWDEDRQVLSLILFGRASSLDRNRSHADIRDMSWAGAFGNWEFRAGISKVYWGVTESQHLVDTINQTDFVEGIDGEEKLGQPMLNVARITDFGTFDLFVLPYFRERTFAGDKGRLRFAIPIDVARPVYQSPAGRHHIDFAVRWSHMVGDLEWGIHYFRGTDRNPAFILDSTSGPIPVLRPFYVQSDQAGLAAQYTSEAWLLKWEALVNDRGFGPRYFATVGGFEYTFVGLLGDADVGVLLEYSYDDRGVTFLSPNQNDAFLGARLAMNDAAGTEVLAGIFWDTQLGSKVFRLEGARRLGDSMKLNVEANVFSISNAADPFFSFRNDSYLQIELLFLY